MLLPGEFVRVTVCIAEDGAAQGIRKWHLWREEWLPFPYISFISEHGPAAMGKLLSGRKAGPGPLLSLDRQRIQYVLVHKPLPMLANTCPWGQMQRELLSSKMLLRVELSISELPAEG